MSYCLRNKEYYFLRVTGIKTKDIKPFKKAKKELEYRLRKEKEKEAYRAYISQLREKAYTKIYS